jgi:alkanesulfonate monooxygenase SsuD/methylene tetrahydromethanopterin reductase-like flavin-dependent oxidoreductase (luciferase family)
VRALWEGGETDYSDEHVTYARAVSRPRPVAGGVPIHIGGHSDVAARRAGRLGDGFFPGSQEDLPRILGIVREHAERAGRDPDAVEVTVTGEALFGGDPQAEVEGLAAAGVHRIVIPPLAFDAAGITGALATFGERVITPSR